MTRAVRDGSAGDAQPLIGSAVPETYELMVCGWERNPRHCVYLNDYRVAGGKPWGGSHSESHWSVTLDDLAAAIPAIREMREALRRIAAGDGVYGSQAHEYKQIARAALSKASPPNGEAEGLA